MRDYIVHFAWGLYVTVAYHIDRLVNWIKQ